MFALLHPRWTRAEILVSAGLLGLVLLTGLAGDAAREWLRFDRAAIAEGEVWRLVTAHFVHLGGGHLLLDLTGLTLLLLFFRDVFSPRDWLVAVLAGSVLTGLALWWCSPGIGRYVGISGVLHTLLFAGLLLSFRDTPLINGVVFFAMSARIWTEQQAGFDVNHMQSLIGGAVAVDAHLYGALSALPVTLLLWRSSRERQLRFRQADASGIASP